MLPQAFGGNEEDIPDWWVAYWPAEDAIVVAHQGTNFHSFKSIMVSNCLCSLQLAAVSDLIALDRR